MKLRGYNGGASCGDLERRVENKHTFLIWTLAGRMGSLSAGL